MKIMELESILDDILSRTWKLIQNGRRGDILNERFFHHMFSTLTASYLSKKGEDIWESLLLVPEFPTQERFRWSDLRLNDAEYTRRYAVGKGVSGQIDFAIRCKPIILIEWNGPGLYQPKDVAKDMLKLLSQDESYLKVFAAIITSSRTGRSDHMLAVREHLEAGLKFAFDVLGINHPTDKNLYIYVATVTEKPVKIYWGSCVKRGL